MNTWKWLGKVCSLTPGTKRISLKLYYAWKSKQYQRFYARQCETQRIPWCLKLLWENDMPVVRKLCMKR